MHLSRMGIPPCLPAANVADNVGCPNVVALRVDDLPGFEQEPEVVVRGHGGIELVALFLLDDLWPIAHFEEVEGNINVLGSCGSILWGMGGRLVVSVVCELLTVVVENAVRSRDGEVPVVHLEVGVVCDHGLEGALEMIRHDHDRIRDVKVHRFQFGLVVGGGVVIVMVVVVAKGRGDGATGLGFAGSGTWWPMELPPGVDLGKDLNDRPLDGVVLAIMFRLGIIIV